MATLLKASKAPVLAADRRYARWILATGVAATTLFVGVAALLAATLPYRLWDSLAFGSWSRLIAAGHWRGSGVGPSDLHRPLFYVGQGLLWALFGFHEWLGGLLSLAFAVLLVFALVRLARTGAVPALQAGVMLLLILAVGDVQKYVVAGLSDIPVAATVALAAAVLWTMRDRPLRVALLVLAGALAVLAKPSALPGLLGLVLAELLGPRAGVRERAVRGVLPLVGGVALALVYDWTQALALHTSLPAFLRAGAGPGYWASLAAQHRGEALLGWGWVGAYLHLPLVFAVAYALLRVCRIGHRMSALLAAPAAWAWAWLAPTVGGSGHVPPTHGVAGLATIVLAVCLPAAAAASPELAPTRLELARLLVWAAPAMIFWVQWAAYDTRLSSAAWPALLLLLTRTTSTVVLGLGTRLPELMLLPAAALLVLALVSFDQLDGLGRDGWRQYRSQGLSGIGDPVLMRNVAYGQFEGELDALHREVGPGERIIGSDDRLNFFFVDRLEGRYPRSCGDVRGYRAFVLLESNESVAIGGQYAGSPVTLQYWQACSHPRLTEVAEVPGNYAVFVAGRARTPPTPTDCGISTPAPGLRAVFGRERTELAANDLLARVEKFGFEQVTVERTACNGYRVVEAVPNRKVGKAFIAEARTVGLRPTLVAS